MMSRKPLNKRYPGSWVARMKVWTKEGGSLEVEGPFADIPGELLMAISVRSHPKPEQAKIMKTCLDSLHRLQEKGSK